MGDGDDELGGRLLKSFLSTVLASERKVRRIICVNSAVHLTTEGSPVIEELTDFERQGTEIVSCGTCLKSYGREYMVVIGNVGDMAGTVAALFESDHIITP
jgi:selenium metabolism protein YedF